MDSYTFGLANHDEITEIVSIYHSLVSTPGVYVGFGLPERRNSGR